MNLKRIIRQKWVNNTFIDTKDSNEWRLITIQCKEKLGGNTIVIKRFVWNPVGWVKIRLHWWGYNCIKEEKICRTTSATSLSKILTERRKSAWQKFNLHKAMHLIRTARRFVRLVSLWIPKQISCTNFQWWNRKKITAPLHTQQSFVLFCSTVSCLIYINLPLPRRKETGFCLPNWAGSYSKHSMHCRIVFHVNWLC